MIPFDKLALGEKILLIGFVAIAAMVVMICLIAVLMAWSVGL